MKNRHLILCILITEAFILVGCQRKVTVYGEFLTPQSGHGRYVYKRRANQWDYYYFQLDGGAYPPSILPSNGTWIRSSNDPAKAFASEAVKEQEEELDADEEGPEGAGVETEASPSGPPSSEPEDSGDSDSSGDSDGGGGGDGGGGCMMMFH